jgi:hypothetical protein
MRAGHETSVIPVEGDFTRRPARSLVTGVRKLAIRPTAAARRSMLSRTAAAGRSSSHMSVDVEDSAPCVQL